MRLQLPKQVHWLLLPPALALLLLFGPFRGSDSTDPGGGKLEATAAAAPTDGSRLPASERLPASALRTRGGAKGAEPDGRNPLVPGQKVKAPATGAGVPKMPDTWQVIASLIGVLLLGVIGLGVLRRVRNAQIGAGRPEGGAPPLALLQSLRLTPKHTVHVVRFDEQVLLLGEAEAGLNVLQALPGWQSALDEREVANRAVAAEPAAGPRIDEDGAVPRDMVLPRPSRGATGQPKAPRTQSAIDEVGTTTPAPSPTVLEPQVAPVNDFRTLLQRAKTAIQA